VSFETQDELASYRDGVKFDVEARAVFVGKGQTDLQERWDPTDRRRDRSQSNARPPIIDADAVDTAPPGPSERDTRT
jgi:hypothetical protein